MGRPGLGSKVASTRVAIDFDMAPEGYNDGIRVLENAWEAIRARPTMYVGPLRSERTAGLMLVGAGCLPLFACGLTELLFGVDDARVVLRFDGDPSALLEPYSETHSDSAIETILSRLFACRDRHALADVHGSPFCVNGVSLAVINALSHSVDIELHDGSRRWTHRRVEGASVVPLRPVGPSSRRGAEFAFAPMASVVEIATFDTVGFRELREAYQTHAPAVRVEHLALRSGRR